MTTTFGTSVNAELLKPGVVNAEFVRIDVPGTEDQGGPTFFFSSSYRNESVSGETAKAWTALGGLVGVSGHQRDLSVTSYDTTVSLAGVDQTKIGQILDAGLKGNKVQIYRGFYDTNLNLIDGLKLRYTGIITSYSINEERIEGFDAFTLSINCSSYKIVLENRIAGRLTNAESWRYWNENDPSMDGVAGLNNAKYNFGQKLG
jgi:hypothetical protein